MVTDEELDAVEIGSDRRLAGDGDPVDPLIFADDLDALVAGIAERGLEPVERETYSNGVRKATYRDPDGNEIGFGGALL